MHFTLADFITDISQNAYESGARLLRLEVKEGNGEFRFLARDDGKGMNVEELGRAADPFANDGGKHPHRKVGLGLPFLAQAAEQSGGGWNVQSEKGKGTIAKAWFDTGNVNTPPAGDLPEMFRTVLMFEIPEIVIRRSRQCDGEDILDYELSKTELTEVLGDLKDAGSLMLLDRYLRSLEEAAANAT